MSSPLVTVEWLAAHRLDRGVRVVDTRWYLQNKKGRDEYLAGHIPGAVFADLDTDLSAPRGSGPGRHPLPTAGAFAASLSRLGVGPETLVVAYDDAGGSIAARLWWLLRHFGHAGGRVLDGALQGWIAAGNPVIAGDERAPAAAIMQLVPRTDDVVERTGDQLANDGSVLLDARAPDRYAGRLEPVDARPGHIPGARSAPFAENLERGTFKAPAALAARYRDLAPEGRGVVCYCGSGVTACHDILALELAGRSDARLYPGSWSDWAADDRLAAAIGDEP